WAAPRESQVGEDQEKSRKEKEGARPGEANDDRDERGRVKRGDRRSRRPSGVRRGHSARLRGRRADGGGGDRRPGADRESSARRLPRGGSGGPDQQALQARLSPVQARREDG